MRATNGTLLERRPLIVQTAGSCRTWLARTRSFRTDVLNGRTETCLHNRWESSSERRTGKTGVQGVS